MLWAMCHPRPLSGYICYLNGMKEVSLADYVVPVIWLGFGSTWEDWCFYCEEPSSPDTQTQAVLLTEPGGAFHACCKQHGRARSELRAEWQVLRARSIGNEQHPSCRCSQIYNLMSHTEYRQTVRMNYLFCFDLSRAGRLPRLQSQRRDHSLFPPYNALRDNVSL